jgi:hypothetical protein
MHIDLDAKLRELDRRKNPTQLTLRGRTYTFLPSIPFEAHLLLSEAPERTEDAEGWRVAVLQFIAASLVDEDQDDWVTATEDPAEFPDELLDETITRLAQEYAARPTSPFTASPDGAGNGGGTSSSQPSQQGSVTSVA